jgi:hypothetical protein
MSSARRRLIASPRPGAAVLARRRRIGLRERPEQALLAFRREPDAGVAHGEPQLDRARAVRRGADRQHDLAGVGELDRVRQEVEQDLAQARHVADDRGRNVAVEVVDEVQALLHGARGDEVERGLDALAQVERLRLELHPVRLDLAEVEHVVDDRQQRIARLADRRDVVVLLGVERRVRAVARSCRSPRSSACGSRGSSSRGTSSSPRWRLRPPPRFLRLLEQARVLDGDDTPGRRSCEAARTPCR